MKTLVIPADFCLAIFDAHTYPAFVSESWTAQSLTRHLAEQMNAGTILAWGTGSSGNWRVEIATHPDHNAGFRQFVGRITATGSVLHLTSYDELSVGAQSENVTLPRAGTERWTVDVEPGEFECRVTQLYAPDLAESEAVFTQVTPHFRLTLGTVPKSEPVRFLTVPWFPVE